MAKYLFAGVIGVCGHGVVLSGAVAPFGGAGRPRGRFFRKVYHGAPRARGRGLRYRHTNGEAPEPAFNQRGRALRGRAIGPAPTLPRSALGRRPVVSCSRQGARTGAEGDDEGGRFRRRGELLLHAKEAGLAYRCPQAAGFLPELRGRAGCLLLRRDGAPLPRRKQQAYLGALARIGYSLVTKQIKTILPIPIPASRSRRRTSTSRSCSTCFNTVDTYDHGGFGERGRRFRGGRWSFCGRAGRSSRSLPRRASSRRRSAPSAACITWTSRTSEARLSGPGTPVSGRFVADGAARFSARGCAAARGGCARCGGRGIARGRVSGYHRQGFAGAFGRFAASSVFLSRVGGESWLWDPDTNLACAPRWSGLQR